MKWNTNIERVYDELAELSKGENDPLSVTELSSFDQLHYHGTDALEALGFEIEQLEDITDNWAGFNDKRLAAYRLDRGRHIRVYGEATVDALDLFYSVVNKYFQSGKFAGVHLCARRI